MKHLRRFGASGLLRSVFAGAIAALISSCSTRPVHFASRQPALAAMDQAAGPLPQTHRIVEADYLTQVYLKRPVIWALTARRSRYAADVNSFDSVPDSTWYVPRPGSAATRASYVVNGPPIPPLSAGKTTESGALSIRDARGRPYQLFLDPYGKPESITAAGPIASRLFFLLGYRTEESHVVRMSLASFSPKYHETARVFLAQRNPWGRTRDVMVQQRLLAVSTPAGIDIGPTSSSGLRVGDVNDRVEAQDRRTLRALGTFAWWLDIRGMGRFYTRDYYVGAPGKGHAVHYVVGLENSLKATSQSSLALRADPNQVHGDFWKNLYSFGFADQSPPPVILKEPLRVYAEESLPVSFSPIRPYDPLDHQLPADAYWAAKQILGLELNALRWAANNGQLSSDYLTTVLARRIRNRGLELARRAFAASTPIELEDIDDGFVVFVDLALQYEVAAFPPSYRVTFLNERGEEIHRAIKKRPEDVHFDVPLPREASGYLVIRIERAGLDEPPPPAEFHFDLHDGPRLVGVRH